MTFTDFNNFIDKNLPFGTQITKGTGFWVIKWNWSYKQEEEVSVFSKTLFGAIRKFNQERVKKDSRWK